MADAFSKLGLEPKRTDGFEALGLVPKEREAIDEQHPDVSAWDRFKVMFGGTPETAERYFQGKGFETRSKGGYDIELKKPDGQWYKLDESNFSLADFGDMAGDLVDIGGATLGAIKGAAVGGTAGSIVPGAGTAVGIGVGGAGGSAAGMAAAQTARYGIGSSLLGLDNELTETVPDIAIDSALAGTADLVGRGVGSLAGRGIKRLMGKGGAQVAPESAAGLHPGAMQGFAGEAAEGVGLSPGAMPRPSPPGAVGLAPRAVPPTLSKQFTKEVPQTAGLSDEAIQMLREAEGLGGVSTVGARGADPVRGELAQRLLQEADPQEELGATIWKTGRKAGEAGTTRELDFIQDYPFGSKSVRPEEISRVFAKMPRAQMIDALEKSYGRMGRSLPKTLPLKEGAKKRVSIEDASTARLREWANERVFKNQSGLSAVPTRVDLKRTPVGEAGKGHGPEQIRVWDTEKNWPKTVHRDMMGLPTVRSGEPLTKRLAAKLEPVSQAATRTVRTARGKIRPAAGERAGKLGKVKPIAPEAPPSTRGFEQALREMSEAGFNTQDSRLMASSPGLLARALGVPLGAVGRGLQLPAQAYDAISGSMMGKQVPWQLRRTLGGAAGVMSGQGALVAGATGLDVLGRGFTGLARLITRSPDSWAYQKLASARASPRIRELAQKIIQATEEGALPHTLRSLIWSAFHDPSMRAELEAEAESAGIRE